MFLHLNLQFTITPLFFWWCCPCVWQLHTDGMKHRISTGWFGLTSLKEVFGYNCIKQYITWDCNYVIYLIITSNFGIHMEIFWSVHGSSKTVITSSTGPIEWLFSKRHFAKFDLLLPALKSPYTFGITIFFLSRIFLITVWALNLINFTLWICIALYILDSIVTELK